MMKFLVITTLFVPVTSNMNKGGIPYAIANPDLSKGVTYNLDYTGQKYFDVYSDIIQTQYSQIWWTMGPNYPIPKEIVEQFAGKVIAITGYEQDQVFNTTQGEVSVPITWAYNHHYCAWLVGKNAKMVKLPEIDYKAGHPNYWTAESYNDPDPKSPFPTSQFISEANGGESRKSWHGYPSRMAQLLESPKSFHAIPMQIDTHNRNHTEPGFKVGPLPKNAANHDPNAIYSCLLECPCTNRMKKIITEQYLTQLSGTCSEFLPNASTCFMAVHKFIRNINITVNQTGSDETKPTGCSIIPNSSNLARQNKVLVPQDKETFATYFNLVNASNASTNCSTQKPLVIQGTTSDLVTLTVKLDSTIKNGLVTIIMSGPSNVWYGVGFNAQVMNDKPYTIVIDGNDQVAEYKLDNHAPGTLLKPSINVISNTVSGTTRTVVMTRPFIGNDQNYYNFDPVMQPTIPFIEAIGSHAYFSIHKVKSSSYLAMISTDSATCICQKTTKYLNYMDQENMIFSKDCAPEPTGDLLAQKNPTCTLEQYQGGLHCCHHQWFLLDNDQQHLIPPQKDVYRLKWRFYYEEYIPGPIPSHTNLIRLYFQTEAFAGEYDIVKSSSGSHEITAHWQVKDMINPCHPRNDPRCTGNGTGIQLIYAAAHCHAPLCISLELWNADNNTLLCKMEPLFGTGNGIYNEAGYISLPPCLWGSPEEGLSPPQLLHLNSNLTSIKKTNATNSHYGDMASWQMRGIIV